MTYSPSYITKNRYGIYYFQYAIPSRIHENGRNQPKRLFRKSLHTRERREALKQARLLWLIMYKLFNKYIEDPAAFTKALVLLKKYDSFADSDWLTVESEFFDTLDDVEDAPLLDLAFKIQAELLAEDTKNEAELNHLNKIIDCFISRHSPIAQVPYTEVENPKLSILTKKWLDIKEVSGLKKSTLTSITQRIDVFSQIIAEITGYEPTVSEISPAIIRNYYNLLKKIPVHRNAKKLKNKTFTELSNLGLIPLSIQSYTEYTNVVADFLKWVEMDGFPVNKEIAGILINSKPKSNKKNNTSIKALHFKDDDLASIFNNDNYLNGDFKRASDYWVPLIALFSGARLGEICQLHLSDIRQVEGVWVIDITDESDDKDNDKSIKTDDGSKRLVPIHQELINLGLLNYKDLLLKSNETLLFPDEKRNPQGKFDAISKRFNYQIKSLGLKASLGQNQRKSFHSFRHTVRTRLVDVNIEEGIIDSIVGHTSDNRSTGEKSYTHSDRIKQKVSALKKLTYHIDFKLIKKWNECHFGRALKRVTGIKTRVHLTT